MAITGVLRPGYVQMRVLDMEQAIPHYRDRVGLDQVGETEGDRAFFRGFDEFDRHSIILREADTPGLDVIGFKVASDRDLDVCKKRIDAMGVRTEEIPAGADPGVGRKIRFTTPTKHVFDLYADMEISDTAPMTKNPDVWHREPRGMRVQRFDHCALNGTDIVGSTKIFVEALDFEVSETVVDESNGTELAVFMSCSNKAVEDLPKGVTGKIDKFALRQEFRNNLDRLPWTV